MNYFEKYHPGLSVDCVIFGFHENELKVLLLRMKNMKQWAVPGGFVGKNEDVNESAVRILKERAGISDIYLKQFHLFGNASRSPEEHVNNLVQDRVIDEDQDPWFRQRFITIGYYALVEFSEVTPTPDSRSDKCVWVSLSDMPDLILDHHLIIGKAHEALRDQLRFKPIGKSLLPEKFTMTELRTLYETILGKPLDRRNFQRKMLSYGVLDKLKERRKGGAHKAPYLYSFNEKNYNKTEQSGFSTIW